VELIAVNVRVGYMGFMMGNLRKASNEVRLIYLYRETSPNATITNLSFEVIEDPNFFMEILFMAIHLIGVLPHYFCMTFFDKTVLIIVIFSRSLVTEFLAFSKKHEANMEEVSQSVF
jgi:hypothetical protein